MQMFRDRREAGRKLAAALSNFADANVVVLALVRGGVVLGEEVARALRAPLDIVLVRKIGAPHQPELAVGAVVDGPKPEIVVNPGIAEFVQSPRDYIDREAKRQLVEIERRRKLYQSGREQIDITGRTAIVVDDGIATGATTRAALRAVRRRKPGHLVLAVPVAPPTALESLREEVDEIICLETPESFHAIGAFYFDFKQVSDSEVIAALDRARARLSQAQEESRT